MNTRQLFDAIMHFRRPDRTPLWLAEGISGQAERIWSRDEGFPVDMTGTDALCFDAKLFMFNLDQPPLPAFTQKSLGTEGEYSVTQDGFGFIRKQPRNSSVDPTRYVYIGAPLSTVEDWRSVKKRYDPLDPRRYPIDWSDDTFDYLNGQDSPVVFGMSWGPARGIKNGYMFGLERYLEIVATEPSILEEVFEFWSEFLVRYFQTFLDKLKVDAFFFKEDGMGFKNSTLISPTMFQSVYAPHMARVVDFLRSHGVGVVGYYSSGNLVPLLRSLLNIGINTIAPMECAAGMDALELRKEYGKDLLMIGNISREAVMAGRSAIEEEVRRKVPPLMKDGGYIPALDDIVMPDMRYEHVKYCVELIKSIAP